MSSTTLRYLFAACALVACGNPKPAEPPATTGTPSASAPAPTTSTPTPGPGAADPEPPPIPEPAAALRFAEGFATPESVLYDAAGDRYLVSNIHGTPFAIDGNGFISELAPDGTVKNAHFIESGKNGATLNAPKGMAIVKGVLYVADVDTVRMFDAKTGAAKGEVKLEGATFANDVAAGPDGKIYVSDSGLAPDGNGFKPSGTDAVWVIEKGKAKTLAKSPDLGRPNGLAVDGTRIIVVTFGSGELYTLDATGKKENVVKLPKGGLDGIVRVGDSWLVSSWEGQVIYRGKLDGTFEPVVSKITTPADIGYDSKRKRILVPRFTSDAVEAYDLP